MRKTSIAARGKAGAAASQHTIPAIDRMMGVLSALEEQPDGASITALTTRSFSTSSRASPASSRR